MHKVSPPATSEKPLFFASNAQPAPIIDKTICTDGAVVKKIKYVQLEPAAFVSDSDVQKWSAKEIGCYWMLILDLYCNDGRHEFDIKGTARICHCRSGFEKIWGKISKKFQIKNGIVRHKRVARELAKAKKFLHRQRKAGLASAEARSQKTSRRCSDAEPINGNEKKRNEIEIKKKELLRTRNTNSILQLPDSSNSLRLRALRFSESLRQIIKPLNQSDRTSFRNIANWLIEQCQADRFDEKIFERVLDYATEAASTKSRNPAAVFTSLLKKELGY